MVGIRTKYLQRESENAGDKMNTKNSQPNQKREGIMMYPEKERLCAILGLSLQATHEEIIHAYQEQNRIIDTLRPLNSAERDLMEECICSI